MARLGTRRARQLLEATSARTQRLITSLAALAAFAFPAHGQTRWAQAADVSAVTIEIKLVTAAELRGIARRFNGATSGSRLRVVRFAFSILFVNRETGELRCEIYLSTEIKLDLVETLSHEAAHCFGFTHE